MNWKALFPFYKEYHKLNHTNQCIRYSTFLSHKLLSPLAIFSVNNHYYWQPVKTCKVGMPRRLYIGKNSNVIREYNFLQCSGGVYIGDYVEFATRVSILSSNHDLYDQRKSHFKPIIIGDYCWLGMHSTILAGVELGPRTIVANGAVVTKSFPDGNVVLAGVPARIVKCLEPDKVVKWKAEYEYYGYISSAEFESKPSKIIEEYLDPTIFKVVNNKIVIKPDYISEQ